VHLAENKVRQSKRTRREQRSKQWDRAFALGLAVVPWVTDMPVVPWALFYLAVLIGLLVHMTVTSEFFGDEDRWEKVLLGLCVVWFVFTLALLPMHTKWRQEKASAVEGDLYLEPANAKINALEIGDHGPLLEFTRQIGSMEFFQDARVNLENDHGHLLLSTFVRDQQGKWVVEIDRNHWTVNPDRAICMDKNYTRDSLEVRDGRGHVVLQVRLFSDRIRVEGEWFNDQGEIRELSMDKKTHMAHEIFSGPGQPGGRMEILIQPLFLYPSRTHWAEWSRQPQ